LALRKSLESQLFGVSPDPFVLTAVTAMLGPSRATYESELTQRV
jgi:hypothetical protein